jgi:hypothetical protein
MMPVFAAMPAQQAVALTALLDLEARWENLPRSGGRGDAPATAQGLRAKQSAYDAYHIKRLAYNRQYRPAHDGESVMNSPARLGTWCRNLRDLLARLDQASAFPIHLLEKAYRSAEHLAVRLNREPLGRTPPSDIHTAAREFAALADWCDGLTGVKPPAP